VTDSETAENPHGERVVTDVTDRSALTGAERPKTAERRLGHVLVATAAEEAEADRVRSKFEVIEGAG